MTWPLRYWLIRRLAGRHAMKLTIANDALPIPGSGNTLLAIRR